MAGEPCRRGARTGHRRRDARPCLARRPDGDVPAAGAACRPNMTLWTVSLPDGTPERYAAGALADPRFAGGHLRFSPDGTRVMAWLGPGLDNLDGFWEIPLPSGEPRGLLPSMTGAGRVPPVFTWLPDNRHLVVTRSDGPTPGTHLWLADTRDRRRHSADDHRAQRELAERVARRPHAGVRFAGHGFRSRGSARSTASPLRPFLEQHAQRVRPGGLPGEHAVRLRHRPHRQPADLAAERRGIPAAAAGHRGRLRRRRVAGDRVAGIFPGRQTLGVPARGPSDASGQPRGLSAVDHLDRRRHPVPIGGDATYQDAPTWSPDGEWIAYVSGQGLPGEAPGAGEGPGRRRGRARSCSHPTSRRSWRARSGRPTASPSCARRRTG